MSWVDFALVGLLIVCTVIGARRGLIRAFAGVLGLLLGAAAGYAFGDAVAAFLPDAIADHGMRVLISFAVVFLVVFFAIELIGVVLSKLLNLLPDGWMNKTGGAVGGLAFSSFLISIAAISVTRLAFDYPDQLVAGIKESWTLELLDGSVIPVLLSLLQKA